VEFTRELAQHGMTDSKILLQRLKETEVPTAVRKIIEARIRRDSTRTKKQR